VLGGIGFELRPIDRDVPEFHQSRLLAELENLHEQPRKRLQMPLAELRDRVVVRVLVASDHAQRHVLVRPALDPPRRWLAHAVRVHKHRHHHARVIPRAPAQVLALASLLDRRQVQLPHHVQKEQRQVPLRQPLTQIRRQQQTLIDLVRQVPLRHALSNTAPPPRFRSPRENIFPTHS
jgi:hypothetical protein